MTEQNQLMPLYDGSNSDSVPAIPERVTMYPAYAHVESEMEEPVVPLAHYLWILRRHKWRILAFVAVCVVSTVIISSRLTPIYEATATIDVDRQAPTGIIGQEATRNSSDDADQFLATQIKTIQSDSVLRPVAKQFHISVNDDEKRGAKAGSQLSTVRAEDAPVSLPDLKVSRPTNTYLLLITYRSPDPVLAANVANAVAQSYIQHSYNIRFRASAGLSVFMEKQIEELKAKMERSSAALAQFEKDLSVINPDEKTSILSARLLQLNSEFTSAEADRVRKQAAYDSVKGGSFEAAQASTQGEQLRKLADRLDEARERFAVVKTQYGSGHPEYKKAFSQLSELEHQFDLLKNDIINRVGLEYQEATNRESMLKNAVGETKAEFDRLNARSFEYKAVKREAEADKTFYEELEHKIKEAGINSSFQNNSIRMSDSARPALSPVFPNLKFNLILAFFFSSLTAVGAAVIADLLDNTVRDPEQIQRNLKAEVLGSLPVVKAWRGRVPLISKSDSSALVKSGRVMGQDSGFEEAVRTLRDSILLSDFGRRPHSLLLTSATPREGKTTTAVHLAVAHSLQGRKTLLIDADLRRPGVDGRFGLTNTRGMSTIARGEIEWRDAIQKLEAYPDLDVITAGPASRRAADRLGSILERLLSEAETEYDLVIIDAPPLLGFAEPLQMAAVVDGVVVITMAGQTNRKALGSVLASLRRIKTNIMGVVLNEVRADMSDRYYYYGYYGKYYSKYYQPLQS
jgi:succinoglycan biosynthesis transport protein ExoP